MQNTVPPTPDPAVRKRGRLKLILLLLVCASPLIFSYLTYYVIKPSGRTNYGTLVDPRQHPMPRLGGRTLDGKPASLKDYQGKWLMLRVGPGACDQACHQQLLTMRQVRLMQGKEMERIERVWLITDDAPLDTMVMREFDGTRMLRVDPSVLAGWLPAGQGGAVTEHIFMVDPRGNLMMRWPKQVTDSPKEASKMKKDVYKLLKASAIG